MDALALLYHFYPEDTPLRQLLLKHSTQVRDKALEIAARSSVPLDLELVSAGALLHDIGIGGCHAPSILCEGTAHYITHGVLGAEMLRGYDAALEPCARICERHTGAGITAEEAAAQGLPLPPGDYLPVSNEEKLVCLADKFFSKSGSLQEKSLAEIRRGIAKFGAASSQRFDEMCRLFAVC